jgi:RNA polymerase sigma factor (sigma-70 family)
MAVPSEGHAAAAPSRFASEGEATRLLYERHQRKILSFCKHQLGSREEAEDATQITFLNAFRGMRRGTSPEFESAWLFKIAHNVCLTKQRNSYRRGLIEAPSDFTLIEERVPAHENDADELFGLPAALRVIPEQQRRALLLREWQGLAYKEIADEMRLSQAAVETLLFRARRSLADALTKDPAEKPKRGRPRTTSNLGSGIAAVKSLLIGGSVKVAATVATVAATSAVTVTPAVRHDVMTAVGDSRSKPTAAPKTARNLHVLASVTPLSHPAPPPAHATLAVATAASHQTHIATPTARIPMVAAEEQPATPVEHPAAVPSASATAPPGPQAQSVPIPAPGSAPAPVSRDTPPSEPDPAPAPAPAPVSANTPPAPVQQSTPSPSPAPATATAGTPAAAGPTSGTNTPTVVTTTPTTTTQTVNAPVITTPTVTTTAQPAPVQTTTTQTITTAAPPPPAPVDDTPTLNGPPPPYTMPALGKGINTGWTGY